MSLTKLINPMKDGSRKVCDYSFLGTSSTEPVIGFRIVIVSFGWSQYVASNKGRRPDNAGENFI